MPFVTPRTLKGFRDYLPGKMIPRQKLLAGAERVFQSFGFVPLMTPALEFAEILTGKYGDEGDSLLYRFLDNGGRDVALRYDLTVPLARVVAQYPEIQLPFRRYQIAPVWRAEKPARGRFREFVQCDGDIVGSSEMIADAEILQLAASLLEALGVSQYALRINNRKVLSGLMRKIGVGAEHEKGVLRTIDKLPKIGNEETARLLEEENRLGREQVNEVFRFLGLGGSAREVLDGLAAFFAGDGAAGEGVAELRQVLDIVDAAGLRGRVAIDPSIARGLDYYTGTIYEVFLGDLPGFGAVMGGGRYDGLIGMFKGSDVPAVGISLGVDRLLEGLCELGLLVEAQTVATVLVSVFDASMAPRSAEVASRLRRAGVACELFPALSKLGKQFRYAERLGMRWVVVLGPDEASRSEVAVKDLRTGEQVVVPEPGLEAYFAVGQRGA